MVDTRRRNRNPFDDDNGYGDIPVRRAEDLAELASGVANVQNNLRAQGA